MDAEVNLQTTRKINLKEGEQFHYEFIIENRVVKIYQDNKKITIALDNTATKELINELKYRFKNYELDFKTVAFVIVIF